MEFQGKYIQCFDCGTTFTFTIEEQEIFKSKGFVNDPIRCPECRRVRKSNNGNGNYNTPRQMFFVTCNECGQSTEVPFQPRNDKPVYCSNCGHRNSMVSQL